MRRALAMSSKDEAHLQLEHLRAVSKRRNVSFRIIPLEAGLHAGMLGMFTIFQFADDIDRDVVHVETHFGDRYLEEETSVLRVPPPLRRGHAPLTRRIRITRAARPTRHRSPRRPEKR